jgi:sulfatase-like protein
MQIISKNTTTGCGRWVSKETLIFATLPILIPNLIYVGLSFFYSPSRTMFIGFLAMTCLLGLVVNRFVFLALLFLVMAFDALVFVSFYFQMPLSMILDSLRYAGGLSAWDSMVYLMALTLLLGSFGLTYSVVLKMRQHRNSLGLIPFLLVVVAFSAVDWWVNLTPQNSMSARNQFSESYVSIKEAASVHAGLEERFDDPGQHNFLVVMVEGLGAFESIEHQRIVWEPLLDARVKRTYVVESGTTDYFGSTTSAEARELCNLKADYRDFRERDSADCLPTRALEAGYATAAFHAFSGEFFERFDWYPKIGFQELNFFENNAGIETEQPLPRCGITFRGLCDADVAKSVEGYLTSNVDEEKFVYWLTLNSHKPVKIGEVPERLGCENGGVFDDRELCRMSEQWLNISYLVKEIALNEGLAETEILLVGDHHPPLFTRHGRNQFQPGKVAWLHLKPRPKPMTGTTTAAAKSK